MACLIACPVEAVDAARVATAQAATRRVLPEPNRLSPEIYERLAACLEPRPDLDFPFNVRRYGAFGDGQHDDTVAIQCAIDAAEAYAASIAGSGANAGALVYFPGGDYRVSATLTVEHHAVSLRGAGARTTTLTRVPEFTSGDTIVVRNPVAGQFIFGNEVSGMRLVATSETASGAHLRLVNCVGGSFSDLQLEEQYGGLLIQGGVGLRVTNTNVFSDRYFGTLKAGSYFVKIEDSDPVNPNVPLPAELYFVNANWRTSTAAGTVQHGLRVHSGDDLLFTQVHVMGANVANVLIHPGPQQSVAALRFTNSYFDWTDGVGDGSVVIQGQTSGLFGPIGFDNSVFFGGGGSLGHTEQGLLVNAGSNVAGVSLTSSSIFGYGSHGVHLAAGSNVLVHGNQIANNNVNGAFGAGVMVQPGVTDFHVTNNIIGPDIAAAGTRHNYSVVVAGAPTNPANRYVITGNTLRNNLDGSLVDGGGPTKLVGSNLTQ